jgi:hypothetical protein
VTSFPQDGDDVSKVSAYAVLAPYTDIVAGKVVSYASIVPPISTETTVAINPTTVVVNVPVTFTATVTPASGGTPSGSIQFMDGATNIGTAVALVDGAASIAYTYPTLADAQNLITATYLPDMGWLTSQGTARPMSVTVHTPILQRDLTVFSDNGTAYESNAVIGSIVLAYPGQLAEVVFLTYDSPKLAGANLPLLGVILDEALPYYTGDFTTLNNIVNDPPLLPESASLTSKRAYMSQSQLPAWCRSMQVKVDFGADAYPEEILSLTVFGGHQQEL